MSSASETKVVVTRPFDQLDLTELAAVKGVNIRVLGDGVAADRGQLEKELVGATAIVSMITERFDRSLLGRLPMLKVLSNMAVGFDNIDVEAANDLGVVVCNTPDVLTETTAELAIALMFAASRRIVESDRFVRDGRWTTWAPDMLMGRDLSGGVLGVVGAGRIGRAVAARGSALGMSVVYSSRTRVPDLERSIGARRLSLEELLASVDVVSLHVPLSEETVHLLNEQRLALMKPTAVLVNTARGQVVDERALASALASGRLFAAGLDVFEREPVVSPELLELDNVVLLPHIGSATVATRRRMAQVAVENVRRFLVGSEPLSMVNPEAWSGAPET